MTDGDDVSRGKRYAPAIRPSDGAMAGGQRPESVVSGAKPIGDPRLLGLLRNDIQCVMEMLSDTMPERRAASWLGTAIQSMPMDVALKMEAARKAKERQAKKETADRAARKRKAR